MSLTNADSVNILLDAAIG